VILGTTGAESFSGADPNRSKMKVWGRKQSGGVKALTSIIPWANWIAKEVLIEGQSSTPIGEDIN